MIKVNVEYTLINTEVKKVTVTDDNDISATSLEKAMAKGLEEFINNEVKKLLPQNNDINNILSQIGK